ncbi:glycosyltransferase [Pseudonocardia nematodicida]|uniref:Glycosyltransferase n=1 Tax=Pseudonocardia nematodicida TaxID=1206997 RepID=A0ABV1K7H7_9PSEU
MRILIGADTYPPDVNGAASFGRRLATGLTAAHEVHVAAPAPSPASRTARRGGIVEHRVRSLPVLLRRGFRVCPPVGLDRIAGRILDTVRPDLVHVQSHVLLGRALLTAARGHGIPVVATHHVMPENVSHHLPVRGVLRDRLHRRAWATAARTLSGADLVTAPTPWAAELVEAAGVRAPVRPISCGTDLSRFRAGTDTAAFRARYGVAHRPTITYVGRLDAEKNLDVLVHALPAVRRRIPGAQLMLVGDGDRRRRLAALARSHGVAGAVLLTGYVDDADLPAAYAAADVFVNPGTAELQSLVMLEAMASGLPVLGADSSALHHLVREDHNGHLFPPADPALLAERLVAVLADPERAALMGKRSRALAERHDTADTVAAYDAVYHELVASPRC